MGINKQEKKTLELAAEIIGRELKDGGPVKIPGFGVFKLSEIKVGPVVGEPPTHVQNVVRFKAFTALKDAVANKRKL